MEKECEIGWRGMGVIVREVERLLGLVLDACSNVCAIERERELVHVHRSVLERERER